MSMTESELARLASDFPVRDRFCHVCPVMVVGGRKRVCSR